MKRYDDLTDGLRAVLLQYTRGYKHWVSFTTGPEKLDQLESKWAEDYGINLDANQRHYRRKKGLSNGYACSMPIIGNPYGVEVILMTDQEVPLEKSPFAREEWRHDLPRLSRFIMVHDVDPSGKKNAVWTWRLLEKQQGDIQHYMVNLVKTGTIHELQEQSHHLVRLYPMFSGVRRQVRHILRGAKKLHEAMRPGTVWPGPDPERLPSMGDFTKAGETKKTSPKAKARAKSLDEATPKPEKSKLRIPKPATPSMAKKPRAPQAKSLTADQPKRKTPVSPKDKREGKSRRVVSREQTAEGTPPR